MAVLDQGANYSGGQKKHVAAARRISADLPVDTSRLAPGSGVAGDADLAANGAVGRRLSQRRGSALGKEAVQETLVASTQAAAKAAAAAAATKR